MAAFDIRAWRAEHGVPDRITDPATVKRVTELLRRDLTQRRASGAQRQPTQDRTGRRNADDGQRAD